MDDDVVQRVLQEGGRDFFQQPPSTSSILQSLPLHAVLILCSFHFLILLFFSIFSLLFLKNRIGNEYFVSDSSLNQEEYADKFGGLVEYLVVSTISLLVSIMH